MKGRKKPICLLAIELINLANLFPVYIVLYFFLHTLYAFSPIVFLNSLLSINAFNDKYQSLILLHKRPVSLWIITCLNAPILLAIVGILTKDASTHLFSLFASLKIVSSIGAIFISTFDIISGNSLQSVKFFFIIWLLNIFKSSGYVISHDNNNCTLLNSFNI